MSTPIVYDLTLQEDAIHNMRTLSMIMISPPIVKRVLQSLSYDLTRQEDTTHNVHTLRIITISTPIIKKALQQEFPLRPYSARRHHSQFAQAKDCYNVCTQSKERFAIFFPIRPYSAPGHDLQYAERSVVISTPVVKKVWQSFFLRPYSARGHDSQYAHAKDCSMVVSVIMRGRSMKALGFSAVVTSIIYWATTIATVGWNGMGALFWRSIFLEKVGI